MASRVSALVGPMGRTSFVLMAAQVLTYLLGYVFWLLVARSAPAEAVGEVGAVLSLLSVVALVSAAGFSMSALVDMSGASSYRAGQVYSAAVLGCVVVALLVSSAVVAVNRVFGLWPLLSRPYLGGLLVVAAVFMVTLSVMDAAAVARHRAALVPVRALSASGSRVLAAGTVIFLGVSLGVSELMFLWTASLVLTVVAVSLVPVLLWPASRRRGGGSVSDSGGVWLSPSAVFASLRELVGRSWWNQVGVLAASLTPAVLPLIVTWRAGAVANAGFFLAWQLAGGTFMVASAASRSLIAHSGGAVSSAHFARALRLVFMLGVPAALAVAVVGPFVLAFLGEEYAAGTVPLWLFSASFVPAAVVSMFVARMRLARRDAAAAFVTSTVLVAAVSFAFVLSPGWSASGAAAGFLAANCLGCVAVWFVGGARGS